MGCGFSVFSYGLWVGFEFFNGIFLVGNAVVLLFSVFSYGLWVGFRFFNGTFLVGNAVVLLVLDDFGFRFWVVGA